MVSVFTSPVVPSKGGQFLCRTSVSRLPLSEGVRGRVVLLQIACPNAGWVTFFMVSVFTSPVAPSKGGQFLCEDFCIASPPQRGGKGEGSCTKYVTKRYVFHGFCFYLPVAPSKGGQYLCVDLCIASPPQRGGKGEGSCSRYVTKRYVFHGFCFCLPRSPLQRGTVFV